MRDGVHEFDQRRRFVQRTRELGRRHFFVSQL